MPRRTTVGLPMRSVPLITRPTEPSAPSANRALDLKNAIPIMFVGMVQGIFTGKKLGDYFNKTTEDWVNARRIINGLDKANLIAGHAKKFYGAISYTT